MGWVLSSYVLLHKHIDSLLSTRLGSHDIGQVFFIAILTYESQRNQKPWKQELVSKIMGSIFTFDE